MTDKTDNQLIEEFMGLPLTKEEPEFSSDRKMKTVPFRKLQYHTSWDWLMPVWAKIKKITESDPNCWYNFGKATHCSMPHAFSTIDIYYDAVIEFIRWYNESKDKTETR